MTMKKRFLGLALAAMVAVPATTAYAADRVVIQGDGARPLTQSVTVTGTVNTSGGLAPEGKIEVELPTTLSFTVDKSGNVQGANYEVRNNSSKPVIVSVQQFVDTTQGEGNGITVKKANELQPETDSRDKVSLALVGAPVPGNTNTTSVDLMSIKTNGDDILGVNSNSTSIMNLVGKAGTQSNGTVDTNGVSDTFNLVFNIRAKND